MKTKLFTLLIFMNVGLLLAQSSCLPVAKMDDEKLNKEIAVLLVKYYKNNNATPMGIIATSEKVDYVKHSIFTGDWRMLSNAVGNVACRRLDVAVLVKGEKKCFINVICVGNDNLGGGAWGDLRVLTNQVSAEYAKISTKKSDCDCAASEPNWLQGTSGNSSPKTETTINNSNSNNNISTNTAVTQLADAGKLPSMDKTKSGYKEKKNDDGVLQAQYYEVNGEYEGEYRKYSEGKLEEVMHYKKGKQNGAYAYYDIYSGKIMEEGNYVDDHKEGIFKRYKNGNLVGTDTYVKGEKQ
jgi:hypothetical protein